MTITLEHRGVRSMHQTDAKIENGILRLRDQVLIEEARVRLEHRPDQAPAYHVSVHVVTPGPDLHAAGSDHTLDAAVRKMMTELQRLVAAKEVRRRARSKGNRQLSSAPRQARLKRGRRSQLH